jgi:hypothetical protein
VKRNISKFLERIVTNLVWVMSLRGFDILFRIFGRLIKLSQGQGFGAGSLEREIKEAAKLLNLTSECRITIFDVGANIGLYSEAALKFFPNATIYAFEPSERAYRMLVERFAGDQRVITFNIALSDEAGFVNLYSDEPGSGLASLTRRNLAHYNIDFSHVEAIETKTLDSVAIQYGAKPSLIKIDVEGNELKVLKGAISTLKLNPLIQFEFGGCNIDTRTYFLDFFNFFTEISYVMYRITPSGVRRVRRYTQSLECFETTNYLAKSSI